MRRLVAIDRGRRDGVARLDRVSSLFDEPVDVPHPLIIETVRKRPEVSQVRAGDTSVE